MKRYISVNDFVTKHSLARSTVYNWIKNDMIDCRKENGKFVIFEDAELPPDSRYAFTSSMPGLLTVDEFSMRMFVSPQTVYTWIRNRKIKAIKLKGHYYISETIGYPDAKRS